MGARVPEPLAFRGVVKPGGGEVRVPCVPVSMKDLEPIADVAVLAVPSGELLGLCRGPRKPVILRW